MCKQEVVFLRGAKTILRPYNEETDLELCQKWINDPEIRPFVRNVFPITLDQEKEALKGFSEKKDGLFLIIEGKVEEEPKPKFKTIGTMGLFRIDSVDRTASTGAMIGEKECWRNGYGKDAKMILLAHAFFALNLRKIWSSAIEFNENSLGYQKSTGYVVEGVRKKQFFKDGRYWDEVLTAVFAKDFLPLWEKYKKEHKL
jgi:RimJ/RimL family protein N-acetyltransferase